MGEPLMLTARWAQPAPSNVGVEVVLVGGVKSATQDGLANQANGKLGILSVYSPLVPFRIVFDSVTPIVVPDVADAQLFPANVTHRFLTRSETRFFDLFADLAAAVHYQVEIIQGSPI